MLNYARNNNVPLSIFITMSTLVLFLTKGLCFENEVNSKIWGRQLWDVGEDEDEYAYQTYNENFEKHLQEI
ncbi:hypothetical protein L2E82_02725 [Cichorium intybus]|uniref:Uncharacterized protein n=1 Tax=Cichorium intybus TaxID=13427 RepID=A0ACB9H3L4_CICIN|nr:hypothetical protein L2E82_02725 [Cichorium intybus]